MGSELGSCWWGEPGHPTRLGWEPHTVPPVRHGSGDTSRGLHRGGIVRAHRRGSRPPSAVLTQQTRGRHRQRVLAQQEGERCSLRVSNAQNKTFEMLVIIRRTSLLGGETCAIKTLLQVLKFSLNKDTELHCNSDDVQVMWV